MIKDDCRNTLRNMSNRMLRFGEKLRTLRHRQGMTLMELDTALDVHFSHLGNIERGQKKPSTDLVLKVSDLFNVTTDQLMRDELELNF